MTGITKITIASHITKLLEENIIEKKDRDGRIQYYQLNLENPKAKILLLLEKYVIAERLEVLLPETENEHEENPYSIEEVILTIDEYINDSEMKQDEVQDDRSKAFYQGRASGLRESKRLLEGISYM